MVNIIYIQNKEQMKKMVDLAIEKGLFKEFINKLHYLTTYGETKNSLVEKEERFEVTFYKPIGFSNEIDFSIYKHTYKLEDGKLISDKVHIVTGGLVYHEGNPGSFGIHT